MCAWLHAGAHNKHAPMLLKHFRAFLMYSRNYIYTSAMFNKVKQFDQETPFGSEIDHLSPDHGSEVSDNYENIQRDTEIQEAQNKHLPLTRGAR